MIVGDSFDAKARELLGQDWRLWSDGKDGMVRIGVGGCGRSHWVFGEGKTVVEALREARILLNGRKWYDVPIKEIYRCQ